MTKNYERFKTIEEEKKIKNLRNNLLSNENNDIPEYEKFIKMNSILIAPRKHFNNLNKIKQNQQEENSKSNIANILIDTIYEERIRKRLREIFKDYMEDFDQICKSVIEEKYLAIFDHVYHFMIFNRHNSDNILQTVILNTDQNADEFFQSMEDYFNEKFDIENDYKKINFISESNFRDLKSLFIQLKICDDLTIIEDLNEPKKERLIIIRQIQKIGKLNLNLLISRLIEYNQDPFRIYNNILIFDVSYDPRGLFDKIKPNHLCRMTFSNVENIPSKNIYQEVLYKFIYERKNSIFIPNSINLKKIVEFVNNHQISVKSFKNYFKFLLIDFFLIEAWANDEFLIYNKNLIKSLTEKKIEFIITEDVKLIYGDKTNKMVSNKEIKEIVKFYKNAKINKKLFFKFYNFFEKLVTELYKNVKLINNDNYDNEIKVIKTFDKFQFFFNFLQFGTEMKNSVENRKILMISVIELFNKDIIEVTKEIIIPHFKKFVEEIMNNFGTIYDDEEMFETLPILLDDLSGLFISHNQKKMFNTSDRRNNEEMPILISCEEFVNRLIIWFGRIFSLPIFSYIENNNKRNYTKNDKRIITKSLGKNYHIFSEFINPSMSQVVMKTLSNLESMFKSKSKKNEENNLSKLNKDDFNQNFNYLNLFQNFIILFASAPVEFKLKFLFIEYLSQFNITNLEEDLEKIEVLKNAFLYFSYIFYLMGLISRKNIKRDTFVKNYFMMTSYNNKN